MIKILSRAGICDLMEKQPNLPELGKIISINEAGNEPSPTKHWYPDGHENILSLNFSDVDYKVKWCIYPMSAMDAKRVVDFLKEEQPLYVHCHAGVSRSGAVGTFAREVWNQDYDAFIRRNPHITPNRYILNLLHTIHREGLKEKYPIGEQCPCGLTIGGRNGFHCVHCQVEFEKPECEGDE